MAQEGVMNVEMGAAPAAGLRPYRVLHVLDHSWPILSGYSVRSRSLVQAQQRLGFLPQVVTGPLHQLDDAHAAELTDESVPYFRTRLRGALSARAISRRWPVVRELWVIKLFRERIQQLLRSVPFDLVHAHSPALCGLAAVQASHSCNIPVVYEIRAFWEDAAVDQRKTGPQALRYRWSRQLESRVVHKADAVVGIAGHILRDLEQRGVSREKLFHVSNGVDTDRFTPAPRDHALAAELHLGEEVVLGFAGSLYHYEGISWLVPALGELKRRNISFRLLVLGDGEDVPAIKKAMTAAGVEQNVSLLGRVPHDQVQRYYSVMDILVYPRRSVRLTELVTPLKPLEAMSQGKAVLASAVGGIRELVDDERTGLLFAPEDVDSFCHQAARLIQDSALRQQLGARAREAMIQEKDWKVVAQQYQSVYDYARRRGDRR